MVNYRRELRMGIDIRRKEKMEKTMEFVKRIKNVYKKAEATLKKVQDEMK